MPKYGHVNKPSDISTINAEIRASVRKLKTYSAIRKRIQQSRYLYTLTFTDGFKDKLKGRLRKGRETAKKEFERTAFAANKRLKALGIKKKFKTKID